MLAAEHGLPVFDLAYHHVIGGMRQFGNTRIVYAIIRRREQQCDPRMYTVELGSSHRLAEGTGGKPFDDAPYWNFLLCHLSSVAKEVPA